MGDHLPHYTKAEESWLATATGTRREEMAQKIDNALAYMANVGSTEVEHLPHYLKVEGSILATTPGTKRVKMA